MSHIYCIGETVYDIIFKNECPASGTPGGAMLNTSITLGRIGIPIHFISEVGYDRIGSGILSFLKENGVSTHFIKQEDESKTALALAFLDKDQDATYDFYKSSPEQDFTVSTPEFTANDFFLFGSFFALSSRYIPALKTLILVAQEAGALIFYDPNFREAHLDDDDMYQTFNMGIGYMVIVEQDHVDRSLERLNQCGLRSWLIGEVVSRNRPEHAVHLV